MRFEKPLLEFCVQFLISQIKRRCEETEGSQKQKWVSQVKEIKWKCRLKELELFIVWKRKSKARDEYFSANKWRLGSSLGEKKNKG